ncbi:MAG: hypothetical protein ON057_001911 [Glomeribacter sp. 1016415]|nr:hypothetical protein [Glomeribacter sp. 1016415]
MNMSLLTHKSLAYKALRKRRADPEKEKEKENFYKSLKKLIYKKEMCLFSNLIYRQVFCNKLFQKRK